MFEFAPPSRSPAPARSRVANECLRRSSGRHCSDEPEVVAQNPGTSLASAWNFGSASLYNAAMSPLFRQAPAFPAAARPAATPWRLRRLQRGLALLALFSSMTLVSTAHAQPPAEPAPAARTKPAAKGKTAAKTDGKPDSKTGKTTVKAGNKVIAVDEEFFVEGRLEKPSAFYVLRRSATDYDWARLDAVFTPLVLESVQDPLF
jgi:hypothetical protein